MLPLCAVPNKPSAAQTCADVAIPREDKVRAVRIVREVYPERRMTMIFRRGTIALQVIVREVEECPVRTCIGQEYGDAIVRQVDTPQLLVYRSVPVVYASF